MFLKKLIIAVLLFLALGASSCVAVRVHRYPVYSPPPRQHCSVYRQWRHHGRWHYEYHCNYY